MSENRTVKIMQQETLNNETGQKQEADGKIVAFTDQFNTIL